MAEEVYDIYILVRETGEIIHASERDWCRVRTVRLGREWLYCFEDMKGQPAPDYDYDEPVLRVEVLNGRIQLKIEAYGGPLHSDIFVFKRPVWRNVGGLEGRHVGDTAIVDLPEAPPPPIPPIPPPPTPPAPELEPITERLDGVIGALSEVKREMETMAIKANTYSIVNVDLSTERAEFTLYTISGFAMTIFACTGNMEIRIGEITTDGIPIAPLAYPQMMVIDRVDFENFYIRNAAQPGLQAVLIVWRRE